MKPSSSPSLPRPMKLRPVKLRPPQPLPPPPPPPPSPWPSYDVFLSFRGEDTRRTFTDHLYAALVRAGVSTFRDAEGLRRGEHIETELVRIIQGCRISLIVFSENYADSRWCLQELVHIMECRKTQRQRVFPIFYHVDPSHVRNQTGSFGKPFEKHEATVHQGRDKIARWRAALRGAADLAGFDIADRHEAEFINSIVDEICSQLTTPYLNLAVYPVGIESRVEDISKCLGVGLDNDVRMVGIWGMGGIGKTTVAKAIYNKFYHDFDSRSFLADVRETAKDSSGKIALQERLLSDVLKPAKIVVGDVSRGINVIRQRLRSKKVLVIVDDVDREDQLNALAIRRESFGPGSIIVITTRDRHLLELVKVDTIHRTQEMNEKEALELFSRHAFQNYSPDVDYFELSGRVVRYCGGLPLALEVLGSFLFRRSIEDWNSTLKKLEKIPDGTIQSKLRISFDALEEWQRHIFLHICCFFIGMDKNHVIKILEGCGLAAGVAISVLSERCLVTVNEKDKVMMHDLLRDMGREIVREESPNHPERRSRLWRQEDVIDVLRDESGTEETEGLALNWQRSSRILNVSIGAFRNMRGLKLLQLKYVLLTGDCNKLPKKLRWLCLRGSSLYGFWDASYLVSMDLPYSESFPSLVSMDLRYSGYFPSDILWRFGRLEILNLSHSQHLTTSPYFSQVPNLQYLILKYCVNLTEIHRSIGLVSQLALLNLKGCTKLKYLPEGFYMLRSVRSLVLSGCSKFEKLSKHIGKMDSLRTLVISGTAISEVPSSIDKMRNLDFSSRQGLKGLKRFTQDETSGPSEDETARPRQRLRSL
ncbi:disease resistance protein RUN1-like [Rosa rugosa]|uniref:disease resistance protein RUN1-like n=1 Tax=Rosa rugosa TaxID=74645 RepID=UPI002B4026E9|nr:disease resistance protein RUN1-like [Rosa rugosa]